MDQPARRPSPGRPVMFDRRTVIDRCTLVFWKAGYEASSLTDLEQAAALNRSSIYNSFGGKQGLFEACLDTYIDRFDAHVLEPLRGGTRGVEDLTAFLAALRDRLAEPGHPPGCFAAESLADGRAPRLSGRYLEALATALDAALRRSAAAGEVDDRLREQHRDVLVTLVLGLKTRARGGLPSDDLDRAVAAAQREVGSWRGIHVRSHASRARARGTTDKGDA